MSKRRLGRTTLEIEPLVLGTNVVGWTDDEDLVAIFDRLLEHGFNALDTADSIRAGCRANDSDSEKIIGRWIKARQSRQGAGVHQRSARHGPGSRPQRQMDHRGIEASPKRLQTDYIDLYHQKPLAGPAHAAGGNARRYAS